MTAIPNAANSIASVAVATPAALTVGEGAYFTADDDLVIGALRIIEAVLDSNVDNDPEVFGDFRSFTNHYFEQDYFNPRLVSRGLIDDEVQFLLNRMPYPDAIAGEGALRATLSWGDQPDVDLHVFEPNGTHVYYSARVGVSGNLDVDDVNGNGPENYRVACGDIELGKYHIGVNYYHGYAPEDASVTLYLGDGLDRSPRTVHLATVSGSGGDDNPIIMYEVDVAEDGEGNIFYTVQ